MSRPSLTVPAVVVLVVLSATVVGALGVRLSETTTPVVETPSDRPNYVAINASDVMESNTTTVDFDVGIAISADSGSLESRYWMLRYEEQFRAATNDTERARVVANTTDRLDEIVRGLENRNREVIAAYAGDSIDTREFMRERARINVKSAQLQDSVEGMISEIDLSQRPLRQSLDDITARLEVLQGPLSATIGNRLVRGGSDEMLYVEASTTGYTLANVSGGVYTRETFLGDERQPDELDQFTLNSSNRRNAAQSRAVSLYPWISANRLGGSTVARGDTGIYRFTAGFPGGDLVTYLDGGTTNVFREFQVRTLDSFNTTEVINRTSENLRISVERTYETGPAAVTLRDADSGDPINGTVAIANRDSVYVGDDGTYWFVEPRDPVRINASAAGTDVSLTLTGFESETTPGPRMTPDTEG